MPWRQSIQLRRMIAGVFSCVCLGIFWQSNVSSWLVEAVGFETCTDGEDNDGNGLSDCADHDCAWYCSDGNEKPSGVHVRLSHSIDSSSPEVGSTLTYSVRLQNTGRVAAENLSFRADRPDVHGDTLFAAGATCVLNGAAVVCDGLSVPAGDTLEFTYSLPVVVTASAQCNSVATAGASVSMADGTKLALSPFVSFTPKCPKELESKLTALMVSSNALPAPDDIVTFTVTVRNEGERDERFTLSMLGLGNDYEQVAVTDGVCTPPTLTNSEVRCTGTAGGAFFLKKGESHRLIYKAKYTRSKECPPHVVSVRVDAEDSNGKEVVSPVMTQMPKCPTEKKPITATLTTDTLNPKAKKSVLLTTVFQQETPPSEVGYFLLEGGLQIFQDNKPVLFVSHHGGTDSLSADCVMKADKKTFLCGADKPFVLQGKSEAALSVETVLDEAVLCSQPSVQIKARFVSPAGKTLSESAPITLTPECAPAKGVSVEFVSWSRGLTPARPMFIGKSSWDKLGTTLRFSGWDPSDGKDLSFQIRMPITLLGIWDSAYITCVETVEGETQLNDCKAKAGGTLSSYVFSFLNRNAACADSLLVEAAIDLAKGPVTKQTIGTDCSFQCNDDKDNDGDGKADDADVDCFTQIGVLKGKYDPQKNSETSQDCKPLFSASTSASADRLNYVFVTDGSEAQKVIAKNWVNAAMQYVPFTSQKDKMQFWVVNRPEKEPAATGNCNCKVPVRCANLSDFSAVHMCSSYCRANQHSYYGVIQMPATDDGRVFTHEFGHTFGLADEYTEGGKGSWPGPNCPDTVQKAKEEWKDILTLNDTNCPDDLLEAGKTDALTTCKIGCSYTNDNVRWMGNTMMKSHYLDSANAPNGYGPINQHFIGKVLKNYSGKPGSANASLLGALTPWGWLAQAMAGDEPEHEPALRLRMVRNANGGYDIADSQLIRVLHGVKPSLYAGYQVTVRVGDRDFVQTFSGTSEERVEEFSEEGIRLESFTVEPLPEVFVEVGLGDTPVAPEVMLEPNEAYIRQGNTAVPFEPGADVVPEPLPPIPLTTGEVVQPKVLTAICNDSDDDAHNDCPKPTYRGMHEAAWESEKAAEDSSVLWVSLGILALAAVPVFVEMRKRIKNAKASMTPNT